jgi:hypothetical protein
MTQLLAQIAQPTNQAEYQTGLRDGTRFYGQGHMELYTKYETGTADYRMGFDASREAPSVLDPDFAS